MNEIRLEVDSKLFRIAYFESQRKVVYIIYVEKFSLTASLRKYTFILLTFDPPIRSSIDSQNSNTIMYLGRTNIFSRKNCLIKNVWWESRSNEQIF